MSLYENKKNKYEAINETDSNLEDTDTIESYDFTSYQNGKAKANISTFKYRRIVVFLLWTLFLTGVILSICYKEEFSKLNQEEALRKIPVTEYVSKLKARESNLSSQVANRLLCKVLKNKEASPACKSYFVADVIDLAWAIAPLFSCRGTQADENLYRLHKGFIGYLNAYGIPSITIEAVKLNSNHTFKIARPNMEPYEMQSYFHNCSYIRENLLNVAIRKLNLPWEYMMWIDGHQVFENPLWIFDAIVAAEKYKVVQLFDYSIRLDPKNQTEFARRGFMRASFADNFLTGPVPEFGNAYMIRRRVYEEIGYILDDCIGNDCDVRFCTAVTPHYHYWTEIYFHNYVSQLGEWVNRTAQVFNGSRTYLNSKIIHFYHQSGGFPFSELGIMLEWMQYDKYRDLRRDENFSVYIINDTVAKAVENVIMKMGRLQEMRAAITPVELRFQTKA